MSRRLSLLLGVGEGRRSASHGAGRPEYPGKGGNRESQAATINLRTVEHRVEPLGIRTRFRAGGRIGPPGPQDGGRVGQACLLVAGDQLRDRQANPPR